MPVADTVPGRRPAHSDGRVRVAAPLDVVITKYVAPAAKQEGLSRKGRYFRLEDQYSHTLLYFTRQGADPSRLCFEVGYALLPLAYWDFCHRLYQGRGGPRNRAGKASSSTPTSCRRTSGPSVRTRQAPPSSDEGGPSTSPLTSTQRAPHSPSA